MSYSVCYNEYDSAITICIRRYCIISAGQETAKQALQEIVILPALRPEVGWSSHGSSNSRAVPIIFTTTVCWELSSIIVKRQAYAILLRRPIVNFTDRLTIMHTSGAIILPHCS